MGPNLSLEDLRRLPKTALHMHLDGSLRGCFKIIMPPTSPA